MKRFVSLFLGIAITCTGTLSISATNEESPDNYVSSESDIEIRDVIENVLKSDYDWKEVSVDSSIGEGTALLAEPYYIENFKVVSCMENDGTITTLIHDESNNIRYMYVYMYSDDNLSYDSIIYEEVVNMNEFAEKYYSTVTAEEESLEQDNLVSINSVNTIRENEESWWSMGTYFNTSSAYKDRYWRMFNPRNDTDHIYFFSYSTDPEHQYATEYMDFIGQMDSKEQAVDNYYGMSVPLALLSFTSATLSGIISALTLENLDSSQAQNILDIYSLRDKADTRYDMVLDIHES